MTSNEILHADLLDILFDNRNKSYGAYALRREYNRRLGKALGCSLGFVLLFFLLLDNAGNSERSGNPFDKPMVEVTSVVIPPEIKKPELPRVKQVAGPKVAQEKLTRIEIVNKDKLDPIADREDLDRALVGIVKADGKDFNGELPHLNETGPSGITPPAPVAGKPAPLAQRDPEFPGGLKAWHNFLSGNLQVPDDLEAGQTKTVMIRFEVAADGSVTGFEVMRSGGNRYDAEVIRVLKKMPKWKPAIRDGVAVTTSFTQPVTFMGLEQ